MISLWSHNVFFTFSLDLLLPKLNEHVEVVYTITLCTSSTLTCSLRYVKLLAGCRGSYSNHTYPSLFVY
jgi:hypothetical protein